ncbi:hypothetical protein TpMuguga_02g00961 [Theileria parva strain Muguga]|uniref:Uncharacterized protein n=1 Tax=Theileria parva TaxID=5875 RepID=Q4N5S7_THEPA|nr:uncharacterized protein TpMuguga_02g00961 [Theileria parva strain Muguga]EAN32496.1 hypothetical protein TpMuguga_02g00961 [Theileria parva strain Muguga]|eukprot:XP_764779.1 hypothetical protein [Theileria parva strain Muguga]
MNDLFLEKFILFFIFLNKCVISIEVDLNNQPNQQSSLVIHDTDGPLLITSFIFNPQPPATLIREGDVVIWTATLIAERAVFIELYEIYEEKILIFINSQHFLGNNFYYYEKVEQEWIQRTEEQYRLLVNCTLTDRLLYLDREMDHETFSISDEDVYDDISTLFIPKDRYNLVGIYDGDQTIWESSGLMDKCGFVKARGFQGEYSLIYCNILNEYTIEERFYHKNEGMWEGVSKNRYYELLNEIILQEQQEEESGD